MARQALTNGFLSGFMHVGLALVLLAYLPVAFLCRLVYRLLVRPFAAGEDLRGKVVLITGASSGIGEHLAYEYARKGACVALVARTEIALRAVAKTARELGSPDTLVVPADITDVEEARRAVEETVAHFGKLNHLVANAGVWSSCFFEEITNISAFQNVMVTHGRTGSTQVYIIRTTSTSGARCDPTYFALPYLKASRGNIVVTASVAGRVPVARMSFYNASKGAVIRFFETLRAELGPHVRVTILVPGYVVSNLTMGKGVQKDGNVGFDEDARDINVGPLPVGKTETLAEVVVASVRRGDRYVTWPGWYWPFHMVMCAAPELVDWFSRAFYVSKSSDKDGDALSKRSSWPSAARSSSTPRTSDPTSPNKLSQPCVHACRENVCSVGSAPKL
ncbi:Dehydrogenase/reductase SDR family protein 7-like protein [Hordeum vulgare]|nr:Dehydrogenase/reductase SDR family protein 7-like protein [Hordeum vulgare]